MTRLTELLLFILDRAKKEGKANLSKFQMFKIPYLLQVFSLRYAGMPFLSHTTFIREKNGPISINIYRSLEKLENDGYVKKDIIENKKYGYPKHAFSLIKKPPKLHFDDGEVIFLDSFIAELLPLTHKELKKRAYSTEPMKAIIKKEKNSKIKEGEVIDFSSVSVDPDVVDTYSDTL